MIDTISDDQGHILPEGFDRRKVSAAITALLANNKVKSENGLFSDSTTRLLLDVTAFKIPKAQNHFFNIVLPNSPHPPDADILLIVPDDLKNSTDADNVVAEVKDGLKRAGIELREVMTLKQLKDEYSTHEAKRELAKRIDLILVDDRVFKNLFPILGREFYKKKKFPISMKLDSNLQNFDPEDFAYALKKTVINICTKGIRSTIVIGQTNLSAEELTENVSKVSNWLLREFPGGWENIAKLSVAAPGIPPLIVYLSQESGNEVKHAIGKRKVLPPPEEDELSTMPGRRVRVHPAGKIEVIREVLDPEETEMIRSLGVEFELGRKRIKNDLVDKKKPKMDLEDKYVDETSKRLDFEDEEAEAAAEAEEASKKPSKSKKRKSKGKKVKA